MNELSMSTYSGCARYCRSRVMKAAYKPCEASATGSRPGKMVQSATHRSSSVSRDVPRLSSFFVSKSSSASHVSVTPIRDRSTRLGRLGVRNAGEKYTLAAANANGLHLRYSFGIQRLQRGSAARFSAHRGNGYFVLGRRHHRCVEHAKEHVLAAIA